MVYIFLSVILLFLAISSIAKRKRFFQKIVLLLSFLPSLFGILRYRYEKAVLEASLIASEPEYHDALIEYGHAAAQKPLMMGLIITAFFSLVMLLALFNSRLK